MPIIENKTFLPEILAPAGDTSSFLAALSAGADAVYCGLKDFSARAQSTNFTIKELASLTELARDKGTKVYVAVNTLIKPNELDKAGRFLDQLKRSVKPDALIIQDLSFIKLAEQTGYDGKLHLSTLANVSFPEAVKMAGTLSRVNRVVVPRELSIDEIKAMAEVCPDGINLEVFVHGALCYGVSGRCYWSSYLGGKSGLRGRCVQPCRRFYIQREQKKRFFSCQDLSLDVLAKVLLSVPEIHAWKIEGRRKGPHYVFNTVSAYRMFRDHGGDPDKKKMAIQLLEDALGRRGTHYNFLSQRQQHPVKIDIQTGSGFLTGKIQGSKQKPYLIPRVKLMAGDLLRLGYEDEPNHEIIKVTKYVPKKGRLYVSLPQKKCPANGTPVFHIDRRSKILEECLAVLKKELFKKTAPKDIPSNFRARLSGKTNRKIKPVEITVYRKPSRGHQYGDFGIWLASQSSTPLLHGNKLKQCWWWLPPVIWPDDEKKLKQQIVHLIKLGSRKFVLNAPWQMSFFKTGKGLNLWAGPFCNQANPLSLSVLAECGFSGAIVSPELGSEDYLMLPGKSPLSLGIVLSGNWPVCISRTISENLKTDSFFTSPRGEKTWSRKYGPDFWIYPNWLLNIENKKKELQRAGYCLFVHISEPMPKKVKLKKRPGEWNWNVKLL